MKLSSKKSIIYLLGSLTLISCVSIGFATWEINGGVSTNIDGTFDSEQHSYHLNPLTCVENVNVSTIYATQGYGFSVDGVFTNSMTVFAEFDLDVVDSKKCIETMNSKQMSLFFEFNCSVSSFNYGNASLTGLTSTTLKSVSSDASFAAFYSIDLSNTEYGTSLIENIKFSFSMTLTSSDLKTFPKLDNADVFLTITPGEYRS